MWHRGGWGLHRQGALNSTIVAPVLLIIQLGILAYFGLPFYMF